MATTTAEKTLVADFPAPPALGMDPLPDPPPMMDMLQETHNTTARSTLKVRYASDPSVLVAGEGYLVASRSVRGPRLVPDCIVAFGVDAAEAKATNGYVIDEVGKPPDFVLEVASRSTARRDYRDKPRIYQAMRVGENWRFDHTGGDYYPAPLAGEILTDSGLYVPIETREDAEGRIWAYSPALGMRLYWDNSELRFYDPLTGEFLRNHTESEADRIVEREGRLRAEAAYLRSEADRLQERDARLAERDARLAAEAENARLRRLLNRFQGGE